MKVTEVKEEEVVAVEKISFKNKRPCDWNIVPEKDGTISAHNIVSKEEFKGTMKDFNKALK